MSFVEVENVSKKYANHLALDKVNFSIPENQIFGLLGPNGAGKTTFIRILNQITAADSGNVLINNELLSPHHISSIGYLPEERGLYKKMKVGEQAIYLSQLKGLTKNDALKKLKYWFEKFEITTWWDKKVEELSKGMQQKVQFITTVLHEPKLLILDEPFSGFDPINANHLKEEILKLKSQGTTIIFSTHNMASVEELCDNITLINKGKSILSGKVHDIRKEFSENKVALEYSNPSDNLSELLESKYNAINVVELGYSTQVELTLGENETLNDLLQEVTLLCSIHSCNEILPRMDDVFIKAVNQNK